MIRLWGKLLALYGRQWEASYGHVNGNVFKEWQKALSGLSTSQIKIGLDALVQEGGDFPPNLIKFLRLCRTNVPAYYRKADLASLPPPNVHRSPEVIAAKEKHLEEVKKLLG